jgi:hypothetical protein
LFLFLALVFHWSSTVFIRRGTRKWSLDNSTPTYAGGTRAEQEREGKQECENRRAERESKSEESDKKARFGSGGRFLKVAQQFCDYF